jgi:hypothetical protein
MSLITYCGVGTNALMAIESVALNVNMVDTDGDGDGVGDEIRGPTYLIGLSVEAAARFEYLHILSGSVWKERRDLSTRTYISYRAQLWKRRRDLAPT